MSQAEGEVVEIAVGTGLNLPLYGPAVQRVVGVDLSDGMLDVARKRVADEGLSGVELRRGDVQDLDLPDDSADTVVSTFTFCTIPDPLAAAREAYRVLRPGGRFVLAEHGPTTSAVGRTIMRAIELAMIRFAADHLTRDPVPYLAGAGFTVDEVQRAALVAAPFAYSPTRPGTVLSDRREHWHAVQALHKRREALHQRPAQRRSVAGMS